LEHRKKIEKEREADAEILARVIHIFFMEFHPNDLSGICSVTAD
jgi:hypothetical protein